MEALLYHHEVDAGDFPDCCVRCGAGETTLKPIVLATNIPWLGGSFQYQDVELPFCPTRVKVPLVSFNYPAAWEFTEKGVIVKNVAPEFVDALETHRAEARRQGRSSCRTACRPGRTGEVTPRARTCVPALPFCNFFCRSGNLVAGFLAIRLSLRAIACSPFNINRSIPQWTVGPTPAAATGFPPLPLQFGELHCR
jgi:hypothetical protein